MAYEKERKAGYDAGLNAWRYNPPAETLEARIAYDEGWAEGCNKRKNNEK